MRRHGENTPPTRERPASPMRPGEETPIEGGTSTEEIATDEEKDNKKGNKPEPDWSWHSKTKPAEPENCPSHVELEQVTYLVRWLQKDDEHRKRWEANWSECQKDKDEEDLAKRLRKLDKRLGEGTAYIMVQAELEMLRETAAENGQRERDDGH